MKAMEKQHIQEVLQHQSLIILLFLVAIAVGYVSYQLNFVSDQTQNQRNTLSNESILALKDMPKDIGILAFSTNSPYKGRYFRKSILSLVQRYQQQKQNIYLTFIDPTKEPALSRDYQIKSEGEWVVSYQGRSERMALPYTEESFTNLLLKLKHAKTQKISYISAHQEPSLISEQPQGFSSFAKAVNQNGWQITETHLNSDLKSAEDILIINAPQQAYNQFEIDYLFKHISNGGNVIWLLDDNASHDIQPLAGELGLEISQGIAIEPSNTQYGMDVTTVSSNQLSQNHKITQSFSLRGLFPMARRVSATQSTMQNWKVNHLIGVAKSGWLSSHYKSNNKSIQYNKNTDTLGPINIAIALEREFKSKNQRILVIGNHQFLNNQNIHTAGNQALGLRMIEWLVNDYPQISLNPKPLKDSVVVIPQDTFSKNLILLIFNSFQFLIPLLLWTFGIIIWRRKQMK
jgi:hypothetical protein